MKTIYVRNVRVAVAALAFVLGLGAHASAQPAVALQASVPSLAGQFAPGSIWIEGEAAVKTNVPLNAWLKGDNLKLLSGGDALTGLAKPAALPSPCYALYRFDCPASGDYDLYLRHGFMGNIGAMRYRFVKLGDDGKPAVQPGDDEGWLAFDTAAQAWDRQQLGLYRTIEWSRQQRVALEKGTYYLDFQVTGLNPDKVNEPDADIWIAIDAICLTTQPVVAGWTAAQASTTSSTTAAAAPTAPATVASAATAAPAQPATAAAEPVPLFVWIEGEAAQATDVPTTAPQSVWLKGDDLKLLSGGDALVGLVRAADVPKNRFARYRFDSPAERTYDIFIRHGAMGNLGTMRYRFVKLGADGNAVSEPGAEEGWLRFDGDAAVVDRRYIGKDRTIEWSKQQQVRLGQGPYRMDLQFTGPNPAAARTDDMWIEVDAICLTTPPFAPSGALKPGEKPAPGVSAARVGYY